jgi:hypothetical protein
MKGVFYAVRAEMLYLRRVWNLVRFCAQLKIVQGAYQSAICIRFQQSLFIRLYNKIV